MINLCKIDGVVYDALVVALQEKAEVIEGGNSGEAIYKAREIRDIKGIKYAHSITFAPNDEHPELFDKLFSYLFDEIHESVMLEVVHNQTTIAYEAAYSTGSRAVNYINDRAEFVGWDDLTIDFRSREIVVEA